jgi:hypothetical protein
VGLTGSAAVADAYQSIFVVLLESAADARAGPLALSPSDAVVADFDEGLRNSDRGVVPSARRTRSAASEALVPAKSLVAEFAATKA